MGIGIGIIQRRIIITITITITIITLTISITITISVTINNIICVSREHFGGGVGLPRTKGFLAQREGQDHVRWHPMLRPY